MRHKIQNIVASRDELSLRFIMRTSTEFNDMDLSDFVTPRSYFLFHLLEITTDFLEKDATSWNCIPSYNLTRKMIDQSITTVNDGAERILGIADKTIRTQRARKEVNFKNLILSKFDRNRR